MRFLSKRSLYSVRVLRRARWSKCTDRRSNDVVSDCILLTEAAVGNWLVMLRHTRVPWWHNGLHSKHINARRI
jgi:hypothetical protein